MNYAASIRDFFNSPRWGMNKLFGGLCMLIPIIGPIVLTGWLVTVFWRNEGAGGAIPDFDFANFGKYLERGLWPFLTVFAMTVVTVPVIWIVIFVPMFGSVFLGAASGRNGGCFVFLGWAVMMVLMVVYILGLALVLTPIKLRATITQNFGQAFKFPWIKQFVALMWKEIVISWLFLLAANFAAMIVGMVVLCVGMYFTLVPIYFAWMHLSKQLYAVFLQRGGEPVPLSPALASV